MENNVGWSDLHQLAGCECQKQVGGLGLNFNDNWCGVVEINVIVVFRQTTIDAGLRPYADKPAFILHRRNGRAGGSADKN